MNIIENTHEKQTAYLLRFRSEVEQNIHKKTVTYNSVFSWVELLANVEKQHFQNFTFLLSLLNEELRSQTIFKFRVSSFKHLTCLIWFTCFYVTDHKTLSFIINPRGFLIKLFLNSFAIIFIWQINTCKTNDHTFLKSFQFHALK